MKRAYLASARERLAGTIRPGLSGLDRHAIPPRRQGHRVHDALGKSFDFAHRDHPLDSADRVHLHDRGG